MSKKSKIKPVYIEPEDEITRVIEQVKKHKENEVYLVIPERLSLLNSLLNLKLLIKSSQAAKKTLILVTTDQFTQNLAAKVGIQVKESLEGDNIEVVVEKRPQDEQRDEKEEVETSDLPPAVNWWGAPLQMTEDEMAKTSLELADEAETLDELVQEEPHEPTPLADDQEKEKEEEIKIEEEKKTIIEHVGKQEANEEKLVFFDNISNVFLSTFNSLWEKMQTFIPRLNFSAKTIIDFGKVSFALILLLSGIFLLTAFMFLPRVTITLYPKTELFEQEFTIQASDFVEESNYATRQIPAAFLETLQEGGSKIATTGEKYVGTRAKGVVSIKNKRSRETLPMGTILTSDEGVKFRLVKDTVVHGAYVDALGVTRMNKVSDVAIEAVDVGEEGNIGPANFSVGTQKSSLMWGESTRAFSGGESRKVRVVSQHDKSALEEEVKAMVFSQAHNDLQQKKREEQKIPAETIKTEILEENWSSAVGEEAKELNLFLRVRTTGLAIVEEDIETMLEKSFDKVVPGSYSIVENSKTSWFSLSSINEQLKAVNFTGTVRATLIPYFDHDTLKDELAFTRETHAREVLSTTSSVEFVREPEFSYWPVRFGVLPFFSQNITFVFSVSKE